MSNKEKKVREIDIYDILLSLVNHKILIFVITFLVSAATVTYVLTVPEKWKAATTFKTVTEGNDSPISSSLLGFGSSLFGGVSTSSTDHLITLHSRHFRQELIDHFNLIEYFEIKDPDPIIRNDIAHEFLVNEVLTIGINDETQLISITVKTEDRDLSVEIANYAREYLDRYTKASRLTKSKEKRIFLEERVSALQDSIENLGLQLKKFQEENNITELETQSRELISMYSELYKDKLDLESELEIQDIYAGEDSFQREVLEEKLSFIDEKIDELEKHNRSAAGFSLNQIPTLMYEYTKLELKLRVYTSAYEFLYPQLESARIKEIEDTDSVELVDEATPSGIRAEPKRAKTCIIMFFAAFIFSCLLALFIDSITTEQKDKIRLIFKKLLSFRNVQG